MFGATNAASAYARVGLETGVQAASPHKLVVMLFEGARVAVSTAMARLAEGDITAKSQAIAKAVMIVNSGLRNSLDVKAGGELAGNLDSLYEYMSRRLLLANLRNDRAALAEVHGLLGELQGAWEAIGAAPARPTHAPRRPVAGSSFASA